MKASYTLRVWRVFGRWSMPRMYPLPNFSSFNLGGRTVPKKWLNFLPNFRCERESGRADSNPDLLKRRPKVRWVRAEGRERTGELKESPNVRWVRKGGRMLMLIGWSKKAPNVMCVTVVGKVILLSLKSEKS